LVERVESKHLLKTGEKEKRDNQDGSMLLRHASF
jgi:hypothetical protein